MAVQWYAAGDFPRFMRHFQRVDTRIVTSDGRTVKAHYYVAPDYLCVGTDEDFLRLPLTPRAAQRIADLLGCFLSTPTICDQVYRAARVKLEPMPMMCERESFRTFVVHNYIIEGQRKGRKGLIAGHKKDVCSPPPSKATRPDRPLRLAHPRRKTHSAGLYRAYLPLCGLQPWFSPGTAGHLGRRSPDGLHRSAGSPRILAGAHRPSWAEDDGLSGPVACAGGPSLWRKRAAGWRICRNFATGIKIVKHGQNGKEGNAVFAPGRCRTETSFI